MAHHADPDLVQRLAALSHGAWTTLQLEVARIRAQRRRPRELMAQFARDGYVRPSPSDPRAIHAVDGIVLDALPSDFEAIELSPVAPLGTVAAVARASQDKICSAQRSLEVVADPTNVLALIAAERRRSQPREEVVRLYTNHRALRMPRVAGALSWQHFRLACWVSAGRDPGGRQFERESVRRHLAVMTDVMDRCREAGLALGGLSARVSVDPRQAWAAEIAAGIDLPTTTDSLPADGYYQGLRVMLDVELEGASVNIGDLGFVDWVAQLASSRKERLLISALGTERLAALWPARRGALP